MSQFFFLIDKKIQIITENSFSHRHNEIELDFDLSIKSNTNSSPSLKLSNI